MGMSWGKNCVTDFTEIWFIGLAWAKLLKFWPKVNTFKEAIKIVLFWGDFPLKKNKLMTSWQWPVHICSRYTTPAKCSRNMFSVHERSYYEHCEMFSVQVENDTHLGLRSMTYCVYTAQRVRSFWCALSVLIAVCVLSPAHLEYCSRYTSVHTCFGCVLRGRFDHVPAGTVLAGTILFRTLFRLQEMVCTENMFPLELYREQVWTPGIRALVACRCSFSCNQALFFLNFYV